MTTQKYTLGSGTLPDWLKDKLLPYQKMNGTVGYEFRGKYRTFYLVAGDKLVLSEGKIKVKQRKEKFNEKVD